jgi:hypothetical protein
VQLGATYPVSVKSTALYGQGYEAAAKFINSPVENIGISSGSSVMGHVDVF